MAKLVSAGLHKVLYSFVGSDGYMSGGTSFDNPSNGDTVSFAELEGIRDIDYSRPESPRTNILANDGVLTQFIFKPTENGSGTATVGVFDASLASLAIGQSNVTSGHMVGTIANPDTLAFKNMWLMLASQAKDWDAGSVGNAGYSITWLYCQLSPRGRNGYNHQGDAQFQYDLVAQTFDTLPWGQTLSSASSGAITKGESFDGIFTNNIPSVTRFVGNGSGTSVTLPNTAVSPSATTSTAFKTVSGTASALTYAGSPSAGEYGISGTTVTLGDTLANGDNAFIVSEHA